MSSLPEDLYRDILLRVPAESLLASTREYKEMPKLSIEFKSGCHVCLHALGYDHKNDDYKFAIGVAPHESRCLILIYKLSSNSWKTEKTIPYFFTLMQTAGVLVNGDFHWLAVVPSRFVVLSLDISDESFNEMQLPDGLKEKNKDLRMVLGVLEGCLCALVSSYVNEIKIGYEVWKMLDYGVRESWTKLYVIAHESIISDNHYFRLVWSSKNGDILLLSCDSLVLYDPKHESARELNINDIPFLNAENYFKSIVSLNSGT
ncbi:F-box protein CPR1-like [Papaver somniferum]|uniref:F-box protein CPR1-like n=1 Tax=Papaver somniferum TaxID=3469 RepID=UPI000E6F6D27|nr:F-box protein CPR1-like [Papaver somniferum]